MTKFEWIYILLTFLILSVVIVQSLILIRTFKADHERRRKQATIEYLGPVFRELRAKVRRSKQIHDSDLSEIEIKDILGAFEHECVGLNTGVYDKEVFFRMFGPSIPEVYKVLLPYIERLRASYPKAYIEFEEVVRELEDCMRVRPELKGSITHSL